MSTARSVSQLAVGASRKLRKTNCPNYFGFLFISAVQVVIIPTPYNIGRDIIILLLFSYFSFLSLFLPSPFFLFVFFSKALTFRIILAHFKTIITNKRKYIYLIMGNKRNMNIVTPLH
jgi:hypothetical protein